MILDFMLQPILVNGLALYPLEHTDYKDLYAAASDPKIWEQHPNKERWKEENFKIFFEGALKSGGAFKILDRAATIVGSTRYYDYSPTDKSIFIGYTFLKKECWGTGINHSVKKLMLDHIFKYVSKVYFQIGAENLRSQVAISRLGALKEKEQQVTYFGEKESLNFVYVITKEQWLNVK